MRAPAQWSSGENPLPGCRLPPSGFILTWQRAERGSKLSCDSYKGTNPIHEGSTLMISSNRNYLPKASPPNTITWGLGFQHMNLRGWAQTFSP